MNVITESEATGWIHRYVQAWRTNRLDDIATVYARDAEFHERPYETDWNGLDEIAAGWKMRAGWAGTGSWTFGWKLLHLTGDTFAGQGTGTYPALGTFDNLWVVTLDAEGRATAHWQWNNQVTPGALPG
ncbi:nuclear transport factor 2 family protein [Arthrobacter sp. FW306-05-C]|uniref:nuclear transport factor 2 family protein n=1 Tax=Arthrobacter sp. FW306-05-C TaxID=2879620 RepID=UPI001F378E28|nr:nuclear transport factor 2 family protein [Arthrobacter sp. FW306-05-C]UKA68554.1 nuclear transport factor 2 family protein [Arthrobacter sp. FW306-05-C]